MGKIWIKNRYNNTVWSARIYHPRELNWKVSYLSVHVNKCAYINIYFVSTEKVLLGSLFFFLVFSCENCKIEIFWNWPGVSVLYALDFTPAIPVTLGIQSPMPAWCIPHIRTCWSTAHKHPPSETEHSADADSTSVWPILQWVLLYP